MMGGNILVHSVVVGIAKSQTIGTMYSSFRVFEAISVTDTATVRILNVVVTFITVCAYVDDTDERLQIKNHIKVLVE